VAGLMKPLRELGYLAPLAFRATASRETRGES